MVAAQDLHVRETLCQETNLSKSNYFGSGSVVCTVDWISDEYLFPCR
jgi:hypothetical protein